MRVCAEGFLANIDGVSLPLWFCWQISDARVWLYPPKEKVDFSNFSKLFLKIRQETCFLTLARRERIKRVFRFLLTNGIHHARHVATAARFMNCII